MQSAKMSVSSEVAGYCVDTFPMKKYGTKSQQLSLEKLFQSWGEK